MPLAMPPPIQPIEQNSMVPIPHGSGVMQVEAGQPMEVGRSTQSRQSSGTLGIQPLSQQSVPFQMVEMRHNFSPSLSSTFVGRDSNVLAPSMNEAAVHTLARTSSGIYKPQASNRDVSLVPQISVEQTAQSPNRLPWYRNIDMRSGTRRAIENAHTAMRGAVSEERSRSRGSAINLRRFGNPEGVPSGVTIEELPPESDTSALVPYRSTTPQSVTDRSLIVRGHQDLANQGSNFMIPRPGGNRRHVLQVQDAGMREYLRRENGPRGQEQYLDRMIRKGIPENTARERAQRGIASQMAAGAKDAALDIGSRVARNFTRRMVNSAARAVVKAIGDQPMVKVAGDAPVPMGNPGTTKVSGDAPVGNPGTAKVAGDAPPAAADTQPAAQSAVIDDGTASAQDKAAATTVANNPVLKMVIAAKEFSVSMVAMVPAPFSDLFSLWKELAHILRPLQGVYNETAISVVQNFDGSAFLPVTSLHAEGCDTPPTPGYAPVGVSFNWRCELMPPVKSVKTTLTIDGAVLSTAIRGGYASEYSSAMRLNGSVVNMDADALLYSLVQDFVTSQRNYSFMLPLLKLLLYNNAANPIPGTEATVWETGIYWLPNPAAYVLRPCVVYPYFLSAAALLVEMRATDWVTFTKESLGRSDEVWVDGWTRSYWGRDVAIVYIRSDELNDAHANVAKILSKVAYPAVSIIWTDVPAWRINFEAGNDAFVPLDGFCAEASQDSWSLQPVQNAVSIPGPMKKILFVETNIKPPSHFTLTVAATLNATVAVSDVANRPIVGGVSAQWDLPGYMNVMLQPGNVQTFLNGIRTEIARWDTVFGNAEDRDAAVYFAANFSAAFGQQKIVTKAVPNTPEISEILGMRKGTIDRHNLPEPWQGLGGDWLQALYMTTDACGAFADVHLIDYPVLQGYHLALWPSYNLPESNDLLDLSIHKSVVSIFEESEQNTIAQEPLTLALICRHMNTCIAGALDVAYNINSIDILSRLDWFAEPWPRDVAHPIQLGARSGRIRDVLADIYDILLNSTRSRTNIVPLHPYTMPPDGLRVLAAAFYVVGHYPSNLPMNRQSFFNYNTLMPEMTPTNYVIDLSSSEVRMAKRTLWTNRPALNDENLSMDTALVRIPGNRVLAKQSYQITSTEMPAVVNSNPYIFLYATAYQKRLLRVAYIFVPPDASLCYYFTLAEANERDALNVGTNYRSIPVPYAIQEVFHPWQDVLAYAIRVNTEREVFSGPDLAWRLFVLPQSLDDFGSFNVPPYGDASRLFQNLVTSRTDF